MKKILEISDCSDCPYFDNEYYHYNEECTKLDREIEKHRDSFEVFPIPDDCPLLSGINIVKHD